MIVLKHFVPWYGFLDRKKNLSTFLGAKHGLKFRVEMFYQLLSSFFTINEIIMSMDSSWDELINRISSLQETSEGVVNIAPVNIVYGNAYNNTFDKRNFEHNFISTFLLL